MKLITLEELEKEGFAKIATFFYDDYGKKQMQIIDNFKPYFYIPSVVPTELKAIDGNFVKKIEFDSYNVVKTERIKYEKTYESDVNFCNRYLINCIPKIDKCELRIQYTDIEVDIKSNRIISISAYDTKLDKCICFGWRSDLVESHKNRTYEFPSGYKFNATIHLYNSYKTMLANYIKFIKDTDPDALTGWFFVGYDAKTLINSIKSVGLDPSDLSPIHSTYMIGENVSKHKSNIAIRGRVLLDLMEMYIFLQSGRLPSKSLEVISQKELGEGKHAHGNFAEIWNDMDTLIEYNAKDCVLTYRIDVKKKIIDYYNTLRCFVGCSWSSLMAETNLWDTYLLRKVHNIMALPTKEKIVIGDFEGATVVQPPKKGIHSNIGIVDFRRLYPSAIITFNMSPELLVKDEPYDPEKHYRLPNGVMFKKEPVGLLPTVLLELLELRKNIKVEMKLCKVGTDEYDTLFQKQTAIKVLMNALYGAMGYFNFRLATPEIASSTTLIGRLCLAKKMEILNSLGYEIIAGDTDSLFFKLHETDTHEMVSELSKLVDIINIGIKSYVKKLGSENCQIVTEAKAVYKNFMMSDLKSGEKRVAKKRYAGLRYWVEGQFLDINSDEALEMVGYEEKRSDNSQLSRDLQKQLFKLLLNGSTKSEVKSLIQTYVKGIRNNSYPLDYIGISRGIKDLDSYLVDNPHRRGSMYSNAYLGGTLGIGSKPKIIYVSSTGKYPRTDVVAFENPEEISKDFVINSKIMIEKTIIKKVEHIVDAAGFNIDEMMSETNSLESFF